MSGAAAARVSPWRPLPSAPSPLIALVGNPNCGKTALFNILTGSRQKVANYAGVTVERKEGSLLTPSGLRVRILDLPGAYSLDPLTPDEQVTADVLLGRRTGETQPDFVVCVTDATNLRQNLRLVLSLKRLGLPMVVALNMTRHRAPQGHRDRCRTPGQRTWACRWSKRSASRPPACKR